MTDDEHLSREYLTRLREAVEAASSGLADWAAFHRRLHAAVAAPLAERRHRASGGYRAAAAAGAAWWDYAARAALATVPLGLVAALLLVTYLRSSDVGAADAPPLVSAASVMATGMDSARAAFESVLTGGAAPQAVIATLIPVPAAEFLAESTSGSAR
jgi:hypothetical protein